MIEQPDYKSATNAAYELLYFYNGRLPVVEVFSFIDLLPRNVKVKVKTYSELAEKRHCSFTEFFKEYASSEHGYTIKQGNKYIICFNDRKDEKTIRFTIAHEIGHIVLQHKSDNPVTNKEANCFARNLLCPIQISDGFGLVTKKRLYRLFQYF